MKIAWIMMIVMQLTTCVAPKAEKDIPEVRFENMNTFDYLYIVNGCGPENYPKSVSQHYSKSFYLSCAKHDFAYWLGAAEADRKKADEQFKKDMTEQLGEHVDGYSIKTMLLIIEGIKDEVSIFKKGASKTEKALTLLGLGLNLAVKAYEVKQNIASIDNLKQHAKAVLEEELVVLLKDLSLLYTMQNITLQKHADKPIAQVLKTNASKEKLRAYVKQAKRVIVLYTYYYLVKAYGKKSFYYGEKQAFLPSNIKDEEMQKKAKLWNEQYGVKFYFKNARWQLSGNHKKKLKAIFYKPL